MALTRDSLIGNMPSDELSFHSLCVDSLLPPNGYVNGQTSPCVITNMMNDFDNMNGNVRTPRDFGLTMNSVQSQETNINQGLRYVNNQVGDVSGIQGLQGMFTSCMEKMEKSILQRISDSETKLQDIITSAVRKEVRLAREEIDEEISKIKREINSVREEAKETAANADAGIDKRLVIRNLPESMEENIKEKLNSLLQDQLHLRVQVENAERKNSYNDRPGVVIADMKTREEAIEVLRNKRKLNDSDSFRDVMIFKDKPLHVRQTEANLHTLINAVAADKLVIQGGRVQQRQAENWQNNRRGGNVHGRGRGPYQRNVNGNANQQRGSNRGRGNNSTRGNNIRGNNHF